MIPKVAKASIVIALTTLNNTAIKMLLVWVSNSQDTSVLALDTLSNATIHRNDPISVSLATIAKESIVCALATLCYMTQVEIILIVS
jgi:hypothetical protein